MGQPRWRWPEDRLRYANAVLCETLLAAGDLLCEPRWLPAGSTCSSGYWASRRAATTSLSPLRTGGRSASLGPASTSSPSRSRPSRTRVPGLTASRVTVGGPALQCAAWFEGSNDAGIAMIDPVSGGGHDGLEADGRNENQGAESTLAMLSTLQHASRLRFSGDSLGRSSSQRHE